MRFARFSDFRQTFRAAFAILLAPVLASAALVDAGLSYADALVGETDALSANVPRGSISGGWHRAAPGATEVLSPTGYSTPLWQLAAFSAGNDYPPCGIKDGVSKVGGADIPIDDQTLAAWRATLANVRANGALVTPRFAYDYDGVSGCEPAFEMVLAHIRQIAAVLNDYADVVPSIECGIIGQFGEMHSSKYDDASHPEYDTTIVRTWLDELDPRIKVQVRSPKYLFRLFRREVLGAMSGNVSGETVLARLTELKDWDRIGLYNDGYLGTVYDYGTFTDANGINNFSRAQANRWLEALRDIPYGGEIATLTTDEQENAWPPFVQSGFNQVEEWYRCHLSYLRGTPDSMRVVRKMKQYTFTESAYAFDGMPSLSEWNGRNLLELMRSHMGYRFVLRASRLTDAVAPGGTLQLAFDVENTGFGDLFCPTKTEVLLQAADDRFWACPVSLDLGAAVPSPERKSLSLSLRLPSAITNGQWRVYLRTHVVAAADSPSAAGQRTVRFANAAAQWSEALGANLLGTFRVSGAAAEPGLDFRETGATAAGATAPQVVLAALPAGAAPTVPLSAWSGAQLCLFAPGAQGVRYFRASAEIPSENGVAVLPAGDAALGLYAVQYVQGGATFRRDLFVVVPDGWEGRTWRLETQSGRLCAVCDETGESTDPAPGYDRRLPGRAMEGEPATDAKLVFAASGIEFTADPATRVLYPAFVVSGLPAGGASLGDLRASTLGAGQTTWIDSNASGNLADRSNNPVGAANQRVPLAADGAYLTDISFGLVNWVGSQFGTVRTFALNDPSASRGGASAGLGSAKLATLGLFDADPGYHVWFCDESWNILDERSGALAAGYSGNYHAIPIPAATNLYAGAAPAAASTDERCRPFVGWRNLDGSAPGWALGDVALVASYGDGEHAWAGFLDPATGAERLRCSVCGRERDGSFERTWRLATRGGVLRAVCAQIGETAAPDAVAWDRGLPGRAIDAAPAANAKLVFASSGDEFTADPATRVLYPAFVVSGLPAGGASLGGFRATVYADDKTAADTIDSNNSGNMNSFKAFSLPVDGAYLVGVTYALSSWVGSQFGTARTMALNDPSSTRGERSAGLADARLAPLGLFSADPGYHVWFCDADWNVLHEASGTIAGSVGWLQSSAAFPIPAAASLFAGELPHREGTDEICRRYVWAAPDGAAPGWALGDVALVGD